MTRLDKEPKIACAKLSPRVLGFATALYLEVEVRFKLINIRKEDVCLAGAEHQQTVEHRRNQEEIRKHCGT